MKLYNLTKKQFREHLNYAIKKADYFIFNNAYQHKVFRKTEPISLLSINFGLDTNVIFIEEYTRVNKKNIYARENYKRTKIKINWETINNIELIVDDGLPLNIKYVNRKKITIIEIKLNELGLLESLKKENRN